MKVFCADIGTTSLKTALIDQDGKVLDSQRVVFFEEEQASLTGESGTASSDPGTTKTAPDNKNLSDKKWISREWEKAFYSSFEKICKKNSIKPDAVCISGNGPTLVSEEGCTLLWNEKTGSGTAESGLTKNTSEACSGDGTEKQSDVTSGSESSKTSPSIFIPRLKMFREKYPEEFSRTTTIFSGPEYLVWRLTGEKGTVLPEERFLPAYWTEDELKNAGFSEEEIKKLPPFVSLGKIAGFMKDDTAYEKAAPFCDTKTLEEKNAGFFKDGPAGFKADGDGIPVIYGGPDFVMALIGTGTLEEGKICDRSGSSEGINLCSSRPVFAPGVRTLPSVIPGLWNLSVVIEESGSLLDNFKAEIEKLSGSAFTYEQIIAYAYGDKNSQGYFTLKTIDENVRNAVFTLKETAGKNGLPVEEYMTVTGGQAKNDLYLRRKALDVKTELCVLENPDAELTGDAALALVSLKAFPDLVTASRKLVRIKKRYGLNESFNPDMKIYRIPEKLSAIIFDIDSTLYTSEAYAIEQVDVQIRSIAAKKGISVREARNIISEYRRNWKNEHQGKKISLGNTLLHFGVSIEESIEMRKTLLEPEKFLKRDEKLIHALEKLSEKYKMICVTNNPVLPARRTLEAIGISDFFPEIIGLDTCKKSKPAREPFELAARKLGVPFSEILSVGDRYDMDISLPLEMGMGGLLVGSVQDVWRLPETLEAGMN